MMILLVFVLTFVSCIEDDYEADANHNSSLVTLQLPEEAVVEVNTRTILDENKVDDVLVFLFRDGQAKYQSFASPANVGGVISFTLTKFSVESGETLYVLCNTGISSIDAACAEDFLSELIFSNEDNKMMMYGTKKIDVTSSSISIQLERMLAKVTLTCSDTKNSISSWKLCNVPTKGFVGKTDEYPTDATFDNELIPNSITSCVYFVPRIDNSTTTSPKTYMLVQLDGRGWYKLDFYSHPGELDETAEVPVIDLQSNTHYVFDIQAVRSDGYDTEAEAAANPGSNVLYHMTAIGTIGNSNGQYMLQVDREIITLYTGINNNSSVKALEISAFIPSGSDYDITSYNVKLVNPSGYIKLEGDSDGDNLLNLIDPNRPLSVNSTREIRLELEGANIANSYLEIQLGNITRQIPIEIASSNSYLVDFASSTGNTIYIPVMQANKDGITRISEQEELTVDILWCDQPGVDLTLVYDKDKQWIAVTNKVAFTGNIVILAENGDIRWSWHIWSLDSSVIEYDADRNIYDFKNNNTKTFNGYTWMDRNLGAYNLERTSEGSWGLLYQWGRKDPFPGTSFKYPFLDKDVYIRDIKFKMITKHPVRGDCYATVESSSNLEYSITHPMTFLKGMEYFVGISSELDWYTNDASMRNNYLWLDEGGNKTPYNPCPIGWTLPYGGDAGPFVGLWPDATTTVYKEGLLFKDLGYIPFTPYCSEKGVFVTYDNMTVSNAQLTWGNYKDNSMSMTSFYDDVVIHTDGTTRSCGVTVRCVKDKRP